ncbi:LamG domain-containing protein [Ningiella sp. W23]|uniref:LamG domain-containing protein n=1 Tax=Ningiella sp. W23 TaxID=3023715 RepID=UPI003756CA6A
MILARGEMLNNTSVNLCALLICICVQMDMAYASTPNGVDENDLIFKASFDGNGDADIAGGDPKLYLASSFAQRAEAKPGLNSNNIHLIEGEGILGGTLAFHRHSPEIIVFKGKDNLPPAEENMEGSVSLWLKVSPYVDLPDEFVDPIMVIDKAWNDSALFIDFDKGSEKEFRLGVFSDYSFWNPKDIPFDDISRDARPMLGLSSRIFLDQKWTHVAFTWQHVNTDKDAKASLYINGDYQGSLVRKQMFTWDESKLEIILGMNYLGALDELKIFNRALHEEEIAALYNNTLSSAATDNTD